MNESQQAQTIASIKKRHKYCAEYSAFSGPGKDANEDRAALLEIVDSQAQKITEEIEKLKTNYSAVIATNRQRG